MILIIFLRFSPGGVSGAVSKITGTFGKGLAALTLDEDYQQKRRENMSQRPTNLGQGLAKGCLLYTSPSPRDGLLSRMPSSA